MKHLKQILAMALVMGTLAGCGQSAAPTAPRSPVGGARLQAPGMQPGQMSPAGQPGQRGPMGPMMGYGNPAQAEGAQILEAMRRTFASCSGFDATVRSYSEGNYKTGERVSELRKSTTEARLIWVKPNKFRAEVITATNPLLEGGAMATMDGQNITARAKGLLGLIPFKLTASDDKLSTNRNHTFTENNPNSHLARLTAANAVWTILGDSMVDRVPVKMIAVDNVRRLDNQITREILAVEPRTLKLYGLTMYAGNKRVVDNKFLKFAWNPRVGTEKFSL